MTTFAKPLKDKVAATIRDTVAKTKIHAQKISQLESANAANQATIATQGTTITSQGAAITSLTTTVSNLLSGNVTVGGNLTVTGTVTVDGSYIDLQSILLTPSQLSFLAGLGQMTAPGAYPLSTDPNSGSTWASGERSSYINTPINLVNAVIEKLMNEGYMS